MVIETENYWSPAHQAVEMRDVEALARLLDAGADPDEAQEGITLLFHAIDLEADSSAQGGLPLTVHTTAVLLAYGANPELPDPEGLTPLAFAEDYGHDLAVRLLRATIARTRGSRRLKWFRKR
ncbi:ankyrin repeat domain-containing protein [Streptomyces sp. RKAG293]|uniref:ankyrin repeat domain-containing protein n=1 Tax=Streptomyces sp. RKAG293 TaxID=2893403 RepID=UPI00203323A6|nr:ankyrin repeat domain-containing protein [Streptomyces sp. RKAG293]MCM2422842.1 ankyrin repeat domain-containing protein [Streptomyces sp. RKAG293]